MGCEGMIKGDDIVVCDADRRCCGPAEGGPEAGLDV